MELFLNAKPLTKQQEKQDTQETNPSKRATKWKTQENNGPTNTKQVLGPCSKSGTKFSLNIPHQIHPQQECGVAGDTNDQSHRQPTQPGPSRIQEQSDTKQVLGYCPGTRNTNYQSYGKLTQTSSFTRHEHVGNKYANWSLKPERPILIVGDSNLQHLPEIKDKTTGTLLPRGPTKTRKPYN